AAKFAPRAGRAVSLTKEVLKTMFVTKMKLVAGLLVLTTSVAISGLGFRPGGSVAEAQPPAPSGAPVPPPKPRVEAPLSEAEALRKENEMLRQSLHRELAKVRAEEAELRSLKGGTGGKPAPGAGNKFPEPPTPGGPGSGSKGAPSGGSTGGTTAPGGSTTGAVTGEGAPPP